MENQRGIAAVLITVIIILTAMLAVGGYVIYQKLATEKNKPNQTACTQEAKLCPDGSYVGRTGPNCEFATCPVVNATPGFKIYTDTNYGFEFKYPESFNTSFASFQQTPSAVISKAGSGKIDKDGCYVSQDATNANIGVNIINDMRFCLSEYEGVGAGQLYKSYYYTTFKDDNYITLAFVVHTSNGCGVYDALPQQKLCETFMKNYDSIIVKPIQDSVATFKFTIILS